MLSLTAFNKKRRLLDWNIVEWRDLSRIKPPEKS